MPPSRSLRHDAMYGLGSNPAIPTISEEDYEDMPMSPASSMSAPSPQQMQTYVSYMRGAQNPLLSFGMAYSANMPFIPSSSAFSFGPFTSNPLTTPGLTTSASTTSSSASALSLSTVSSTSTTSSTTSRSAPPLTSTLLRECFPLPHHALLREALQRIVALIDENKDLPPDDLLQFTRKEDQSTYHCLFWNGGTTACGKSFNRKDRAVDHVWSHLGYRPHPCRGGCGIPDCDARFYSKGDRHAHEKKKTEVCDVCGKVITVKNRTRHRRSSSCLKPSE